MEFEFEPQFPFHILDAFTTGVVITDMRQDDQPIVYANPAFEVLTGYAPHEILGRNCRFLQRDDQDQSARAKLRQAVAQGQSATMTLRNYHKDGRLFHNELTISPICDAEGTVTHYLGLQHHVTMTEMVKLQEAQPREQLTTTLERITDGFVSFDQDLNFTYLNAAAERIAGYSPETFLNHSLFTIAPEFKDSVLGQIIQRAKATGVPQSTVTYLPHTGKWIDATAYPAEDGVSFFARDITERHQMEQELKALEDGFSTFLETNPMPIAITRIKDGVLIKVNPEFVRLTGYSRDETVGKSSQDLKLWIDPQERTKAVEAAQLPTGMRTREARLRIKSGVEIDAVISLVPLRLAGEPCLISTVRDITAEKQAQRKLEESEARYRGVATTLQRTLDLSPDLITAIDIGGQFVTVSSACQDILGYTPQELIGHPYLDFVHPDDRAMTTTEDRQIVQGRSTTTFQNRYIHKNGSVIWLEWAASVMPGESTMYCVARDITKRRQAEEDQAWLASIVHTSQDAVVGLDLDGTVHSWNASAERMYGYSTEEAIGQPINFIIPPEYQEEDGLVFERVKQRRQGESMESLRRHMYGQTIPVFVTVSPILNPAGELVGVSKVVQDMTERRTAERQIHTLNKNLQQQLDHVTGLRQIDQAITSTTDLPRTLGLVVDNVMHQLNADAVNVLLLDSDGQVLESAATSGFSTPAFKQSAVKLGEEFAGQVAVKRQTLSIPDLSSPLLNPSWRTLLDNEKLRAYHAVPLIAKEKVLGVLEVFHRQTFVPSSTWQDMLETLAGQAAIATDNAQLFQDLQRSNAELRSAYDETIEGWAMALDLRDKETEGHSRRVTEMTVELCEFLGFSPEEMVHLRRGALLHDIGKMGIPDGILLKPSKLTDEEWVEMKKHPGHAVDLLSPIEFLHPALEIPQNHHEKWDGTGYPRGLQGKAIPLAARAFAVVDVYDALTSERPYRKAWTQDKAVAHIQSGAGTHFDPDVVQVFLLMLSM